MTDFGHLLRTRRIAAGLTQLDVASAVGMRESRISQLENNHATTFINPGLIMRLADAIGCSADDLYVAAGVLPQDMRADLGEVVRMWRERTI